MSIEIEGTLQPDGTTLLLDRKVTLPPGKVVVTVQSASALSGPSLLEVLDRIHAERRRRGVPQPTDEQMAVTIEAARSDDDEAEIRWQEIWSRTMPPRAGSE